MAKKDDLIEEAKGLGIELDGGETVADLEAKIDKALLELAENTPAQELMRSRVNRGSRRRIERAMKKLNEELDAAIREFDMQAYMADEDGKRVDEWRAVKVLREARAEVNDLVNQLLAG